MTGLLALPIFLALHFNCAVWATDDDEAAQDRVLRSEFLKHVEATTNLAQQKEHWFRVFAGLKRSADKARKLAEDFQWRIVKAERDGEETSVRFLQRKKNQLNEFAVSDEVLLHLAVRQFALIQRLEDLDRSVKTQSVSSIDYIQQRRAILDEVAAVERLRQSEYLSQQLQEGLATLADQLEHVESAIQTSAPLR
jgi:hypothetical protein